MPTILEQQLDEEIAHPKPTSELKVDMMIVFGWACIVFMMVQVALIPIAIVAIWHYRISLDYPKIWETIGLYLFVFGLVFLGCYRAKEYVIGKTDEPPI